MPKVQVNGLQWCWMHLVLREFKSPSDTSQWDSSHLPGPRQAPAFSTSGTVPACPGSATIPPAAIPPPESPAADTDLAALRRVLAATTALVVAHRPSTVLLADRVALLEDGRITAVGTHHELLTTVPAYRNLLSQSASSAELEGANR